MTKSIEAQLLEKPCEIIAHRGSSHAAPENTLAAIRQAIADGADRVELDVQELRDGSLAIVHDPTLKRIAGIDRPVWELSAEDIARIDAGSWFDPAFAGEPIPFLSDILEVTEGKIALDLELKCHGRERGLAASTVAAIRAAKASDRCVLTSFDCDRLAIVRQLAPELTVGLLCDRALPKITSDNLDLAFDLYALPPNLVTRDVVAAARDCDRAVWVWTVDDIQRAQTLLDWGVTGIMTNQPAKLKIGLVH